MKKFIIILICFCFSNFVKSQSYEGESDQKIALGIVKYNDSTGFVAQYDRGWLETVSYGAEFKYLLSTPSNVNNYAVKEKLDLNARLLVHLNRVLKLKENIDVYPGLKLGLSGLTGLVGGRYFFSDSFGVFAEINQLLLGSSSRYLFAGSSMMVGITISF